MRKRSLKRRHKLSIKERDYLISISDKIFEAMWEQRLQIYQSYNIGLLVLWEAARQNEIDYIEVRKDLKGMFDAVEAAQNDE
jgi:hypothetical protein